MPLRVVCPDCEAVLKFSDSAAGKQVTCPKCQSRMQLADLDEDDAPRKKLKARVVDDEDEFEEEEERPRKKRKAAQKRRTQKLVLIAAGIGALLVFSFVAGFVYEILLGKKPVTRAADREFITLINQKGTSGAVTEKEVLAILGPPHRRERLSSSVYTGHWHGEEVQISVGFVDGKCLSYIRTGDLSDVPSSPLVDKSSGVGAAPVPITKRKYYPKLTFAALEKVEARKPTTEADVIAILGEPSGRRTRRMNLSTGPVNESYIYYLTSENGPGCQFIYYEGKLAHSIWFEQFAEHLK